MTFTPLQELQLAQLARLDPAAVERIYDDIQANRVLNAGPTIGKALAECVPDDLYNRIARTVSDINAGRKWFDSQNQVVVFSNVRFRFYLERTSDDRLRLYVKRRGRSSLSVHVGTWGRDFGHISSARAGMWKLTDGSEGRVGDLLETLRKDQD